jgi:hypothetical protein
LNIKNKMTFFEISFERNKIFKTVFYQKIAHKNINKKNTFLILRGSEID